MVALLLSLISLELAAASRAVCGRWSRPLPIFFTLWTCVLAVSALNPLHLAALSPRSFFIVAVALLSVFIGGFAAQHLGLRIRPQEDSSIPRGRLTWASIAGVGLVAIGVLLFRNALAAAAGTSYSNLSAINVRYLTSITNQAKLSWRALPLVMTPVVGGIGVYGLRFSKWSLLVTIAAVVAAAQNPSRTTTVSVIVISCVFWIALGNRRSIRSLRSPSLRSRATRALAVGLVLLLALGYFEHEGHLLKKDSTATSSVSNNPLPTPALVPYLYVEGGISGLAYSLDNHINPGGGSAGRFRTLFIVPRILHLVEPRVAVPQTVSQTVYMPAPINIYTFIGDLWYDLGPAGLILLSFAMGFVVVLADRRARISRSPADIWLAATTSSILYLQFLVFSWFRLDTVLWLTAGYILFRLLSRSRTAPTAGLVVSDSSH